MINFFIVNENQSAEFQNILMSLIFKILPMTKRIFLFARLTDSLALQMHTAIGFRKDENPFQDPNHKTNAHYLTSLEYSSEHSNVLQITAEQMREVAVLSH